MFHVEYDRVENVLHICVKGFWQPEEVGPFAAAVDAEARAARAIRDDFDVLVESFEFPVQATDVAELLTGIMRSGIVLTNGRAAVVVGSELNRLQAERTLVHPRVRVFSSLEEALRWLDEMPQREAGRAVFG